MSARFWHAFPQSPGARMVEGAPSNETESLVSTTRPTSRQRRLTLAVVTILFVAVGAVAPFAALQLPRLNSFVPAVAAINVVANSVTATLLFSQFPIAGSRRLLVLASGYLFSALIVIPWSLTFPGAIAPINFPAAGIQSTPWLYSFWNLGFSAVVVGYACLKNGKQRRGAHQSSTRSTLNWSVATVVSLVCLLTLGVTAGDSFTPRLFLDEIGLAPLAHYVAGLCLLTSVVALILLWTRLTSVLDLWLMVAVCALIMELAIVTVMIASRFTLGFYACGVLSIIVSTTVLVGLLSETIRLCKRITSDRTLQQERESKLTSLRAALAGIADEARQPLTGIAAQGAAARRFLERAPPDIDKVKGILEEMVRASFRADEVLQTGCTFFKDADDEQLISASERLAAYHNQGCMGTGRF